MNELRPLKKGRSERFAVRSDDGGEKEIRTLEAGFKPAYTTSNRALSANSAISPCLGAISLYHILKHNARGL